MITKIFFITNSALWCGQRKRPNALILRHRTPNARFLFISKIQNYDYRIKC